MDGFINTVDVIGDDALTDSIIDRSITEYKDNTILGVGDYAFGYCTALTSVVLPVATSIGQCAFRGCSALTSVVLPAVQRTTHGAFYDCSALISAILPALTSIGINDFYGCSQLASVNFPVATSIGGGAFRDCSKLATLILRNNAVCALSATSALSSTPIASGTGYIYVPAALLDSYKVATNWSTYASQFRALEDCTVDGTTTGELDPNKI